MITNNITLHANHLAELRASGLTDETIAAAGLYSEHNRDRNARTLNRKSFPKECGSALVFPFQMKGEDYLSGQFPSDPYASEAGALVQRLCGSARCKHSPKGWLFAD